MYVTGRARGVSPISVEMISAVFTGLTTLLAAVAAVLANRSRRSGEDSRFYRQLARVAQKKLLAALAHMDLLETRLAGAGRPVPERPKILEQDDDDDGPDLTPVRANAPA